ncbi:tetratricopeptide repeat protein [Aquiflexum sp.]|uniref:tetratricopeptide repeat-containing sensor histidine kinase n=1 Tax=Aquiflexum sp. TaxID=1872584 RepID=UPI0035945560
MKNTPPIVLLFLLFISCTDNSEVENVKQTQLYAAPDGVPLNTNSDYSHINIDSLKNVLTTAKEDSNKVKALNSLSLALAWSIPDSGIVYAGESISLARKINYEPGESFAYTLMGFCLTTIGNYPLALDYFYKSLEYQENINSRQGQMYTYSGLSGAYRDMGEYQKSLDYIRKSLSLENPDVLNSSLLGTLSSVYAKMNQSDSAIFYASIALKSQPNWSGVLFVLGDSYYKLNRFDTANYFFDRGILGAKFYRTEIDLVDLYHGKSLVFKSKNQMDSAIIYARKAMLEPFGKYYPRGVLDAITTLSNLYEIKNQPDSTLKYLRASIALRDSLFNREKTMAIQNLDFKQKEKQKEIEALKLENRNRIRLNALLGSLFTLMVIAFLLLKNNRNRKKANELLQKQKTEIEEQKENVEQTLTELKSTQAQLIQSEKMASLGQLTAGIAHEIQNPLNFVNNFSEVSAELVDEIQDIRRKTHDGKTESEEDEILEDIKQNLSKINHHGKRADAIVKGMLEHSKSESGVMELTNLNSLAKEYLNLAYQGFKLKTKDTEIELNTDFDPSLPKIKIVR